ncbi:hypothetical protein G6O69_12965 [Pseudenhygromyxa sp. WMMC2535]|uniref:hypothetical protein n=1 Tax=Pseudenhygromyxa sp. WMMC2535 TaxID=2712867 RepID=UPI001551B45A|nr:hypothetical protein [Pseudenhygromyxa sp. WMMC2535]NVB38744.1 hypothetical protein [Pseudenhygromyxa sp. WMMC2535]
MSETPDASSTPRAWSPALTLTLVGLVLALVPWIFKLTMAPGLGEPCGKGFDCAALDGRCVQGAEGPYCTRSCESDAQCPSSGHCGVPVDDPWMLWFSASEMSERFCVPGPRPEQPPEATSRPGEAGAQFRPPEQRGELGGDGQR